jgi:hypothetical protein
MPQTVEPAAENKLRIEARPGAAETTARAGEAGALLREKSEAVEED